MTVVVVVSTKKIDYYDTFQNNIKKCLIEIQSIKKKLFLQLEFGH